MAGEGMAKHVRVQVLAQLTLTGGLYPQPNCLGADAIALAGDEHCTVAWVADAAQAVPGLQRLASLATHRQYAGFSTLAQYLHQAGGEVEVIKIEVGQFR